MPPEAKPRPLKILVVDDQAGMRLTLKGILARRGYQVGMAEDAPQAIEAAAAGDWDLIIMDIKMPGMSGVEALAKIREGCPKASIIMMTAYASPDEISRAFREGVYTVLNKPLDMEKALTLIAEVLEGRAMILVVDDEPMSRDLLRNLLQDRGCAVIEVDSGEECLKKIVEKRFQAILLDVRLPGIDGVETLKRVKEIRPDALVVLMSGKEDVMKEAAQGAISVLPKPIELSKLGSVIDRFLPRKDP